MGGAGFERLCQLARPFLDSTHTFDFGERRCFPRERQTNGGNSCLHRVCVCVSVCVCVCPQSLLTLYHPVHCSLLGFSVHGIFQARILEWVAISFSRGSLSWGQNPHLLRLHCTAWKACFHPSRVSVPTRG